MNPTSPLFGRITFGSNRISLGRAEISTLMIRAMEQIRQVRHREDMVIQIELSPSKLSDSTTFDRQALLEQQLAEQTIVTPEAESPFEGISIGRVATCMESKEYSAYAAICEPNNRIGLTDNIINEIRDAYESSYPDCAPHFPHWID